MATKFVSQHFVTEPTTTLSLLKGLAETPGGDQARRAEARYRLALGVTGCIRYLEAIEAGTLPVVVKELERLEGYDRLSLFGGLRPRDLAPIERAMKAEVRSIGVSEPFGSRECEAWFRKYFGEGSQDWYETKFGTVVPSSDFDRWLEEVVRPLEDCG